MIEITIKLNAEAVEAAIKESWQREFRPPTYQDSGGGHGWKEVMRQVRAHIDEIDLGYHIQKAARERISDVVNNAVTIALRERVKQRAKDMARDGTLFPADASNKADEK